MAGEEINLLMGKVRKSKQKFSWGGELCAIVPAFQGSTMGLQYVILAFLCTEGK